MRSTRTLGRLVLDDDASVGGSARIDVRGGLSATDFARNSASIHGPGKTLAVKNTSTFGIVNATVDLGSLVVTNGGVLQIEGDSDRWNVADGIRLDGGSLFTYGAYTFPAGLSVMVASGDNVIKSTAGTPTFNGPITVAPGATLTHAGGGIIYNGAVNGDLKIGGGIAYMNNSGSSLKVNGGKSGQVRIRASGTYTGAHITASAMCVADTDNANVNITFRDSYIDVDNFHLSWGCANKALAPSAYVSIADGTTTVIANKIAIGDDGTSTSNDVKSVLSVDGGTVHLTNTLFLIAYNGPKADFIVNSGTATVDRAQIQLRGSNAAFGGYNDSRFIQNGGVFNYGGSGFLARYEDNSDEGQIVLKGGEFNATNDWSIPHFIPTCFKDGDANGWTLNQANGTTATWNTALLGDGDVTLDGAATLVGNKEVQGAVGGKWTIGAGFTAGLEGAASLLGGLDIGEGASVTVDIATNRSAVFTARDFGGNPGKDNCITNRFNRRIGGTTRGTITHDETFLFTKYAQADRPFGNMNYSSAYAVGEFYVEDDAAGEWSFVGKCDDWVMLWIDGELLLTRNGSSDTSPVTKSLSTGWHSFRHVAIDNGGAFGDTRTIGYKCGSMSDYSNFSVKNLKMRPAADMGDPDNENTVRWSHYKGTSSDVSGNTFKNDFNWDFRCITNTLQHLQRYTNAEPNWFNGYTVNRYDGWFYVTAENADKEWTFRTQYDDRAALWIDGVDTGLIGSSSTSPTWTVTLSRGWHRFRIQTADIGGSAGPWHGKGLAVSYQVEDGAEMQFSESTLRLSVCPDGYVQGDITLASGASLANSATENAAVVYGNVTAAGTGASISGPFKFVGGTLAFADVDPDATDLAAKLAFADTPADYLADVGAITVDFTAKPTRDKVAVCPAGGLTAATAAQKMRVTVNGEPMRRFECFVDNGTLKVRLSRGTFIVIR